MKRVVTFEKKQVIRWLIGFLLMTLILVGVLGLALFTTLRIFDERKIWDLLGLFTQEWEIISEFWQDTIATIREELPTGLLMLILAVSLFLTSLIVVSRKKIAIIRKKIRYLRKKISKSEPAFFKTTRGKGGEVKLCKNIFRF